MRHHFVKVSHRGDDQAKTGTLKWQNRRRVQEAGLHIIEQNAGFVECGGREKRQKGCWDDTGMDHRKLYESEWKALFIMCFGF